MGTELGSVEARHGPEGTFVPDNPAQLNFVFTTANLTTTVAAVILPWLYHSPASIAAFLLSYTLSGLGLTAGYHRLFAHRSYRVPKWLEHTFAIAGFMALQRGPIFWVAMHRMHHKFVDIPGKDPHTPLEGWWHVHFGWIQARRRSVWDQKQYRRWAPELLDDRLYRWMDNEAHDYLASLLLLSSAFVVGGLYGGLASDAPAGFEVREATCFAVWVGLLHRVALLQAFGMINSICHRFGTRPYRGRPLGASTNNLLVALLIFGEGWHNNHHAFPASARQGLRWYQFDPAWYLIYLLGRIGWASGIRVPSQRAIEIRSRN